MAYDRDDVTPSAPCHCRHVAFIERDLGKVDWEALSHGMRDLKRINWVISAVVLLGVGIAVREVWSAEKSHIRDEAPIGRQGERMAPDRVADPNP